MTVKEQGENTSERIAYLNGRFVNEADAKITIDDHGVRRGDAIFDSWRTFKGEHFKLGEHLDRLYRAAKYTRINPHISRQEMEEVAKEVLDRNRQLLGPYDDFLFVAWMSAGPDPATAKGSTFLAAKPIIFEGFAEYYKQGARLITPPTRRIPPQAINPHTKTTTFLNHHIALREAKSFDPGCWGALILDLDGYITETDRSNFLFYEGGCLRVPDRRNYLPGVTMSLIIDLCRDMGIDIVEASYTPFDVYNAEEAFLTVTSFSVLPVVSLNGLAIGTGRPGPLFEKLLKAVSEYVGVDIVQQALSHLPHEVAKRLEVTAE